MTGQEMIPYVKALQDELNDLWAKYRELPWWRLYKKRVYEGHIKELRTTIMGLMETSEMFK